VVTRVGVLAVQGDFERHVQTLRDIGVEAEEIRRSEQLKQLDGIIIPGGESTTFRIVMDQSDLGEELYNALRRGLPVWGTCAGAIMLGKGQGIPQPRLSLIDVEVLRNGFGRQVDSFVAPLDIKGIDSSFQGVFIRAPRFIDVGASVEVLSRYKDEAVMARQGNVLISSFHPELTPDDRVHRWFVEHIVSKRH